METIDWKISWLFDSCATDRTIFTEWVLDPTDHSLRANFSAFKFPGASLLRFQCNIRICFKRCPPVRSWLFVFLCYWSIDWLIVWLIKAWFGRSLDSLIWLFFDWLIDWLIERLIDWLVNFVLSHVFALFQVVCQPGEVQSYGRRKRQLIGDNIEDIAPKGDVVEEVQVQSNGLQTFDAQASALNGSGSCVFPLLFSSVLFSSSFCSFWCVNWILSCFFRGIGVASATGSGEDQVCLSATSFGVTLAITLLLALVAIAISVSCWLMV